MSLNQQLVASDYDKTFLRKQDPQDLINNIAAVKQWREEGNLFAISTGRDAASMLYEKTFRGIDFDYLVALNGSLIIDKHENVLFKSALAPQLARELVALLTLEFGDELIISNGFDGCNFANRKASKTDPVAREVFERNAKIYSRSIEESLNEEVLLVGCLADDLEKAKAVREQILSLYGDDVDVYINIKYINIVPKGISKATGISTVIAHADITTNNVAVIGDDYNDIPMIEAFHGYAVDNANADVKAIASKVVPSVSALIEHCSNRAAATA